MARRDTWLQFGPLRGQNSHENALTLDSSWASATSNVVLDPQSSVMVKRRGSRLLTDTPAGTYMLSRYKPALVLEAEAELWAFALNPGLKIYHKAGSGAFVEVAVPAGLTNVMRAVAFNGKLFFAGHTTVNRMFCWDGDAIRPVGLMGSGAPGLVTSGTGAGGLRHYKISWRRRDPVTSLIDSESELSPPASITPVAGYGVDVYGTAAPDSGLVTHWIIWGSADGVNYFKLAEHVVTVLFHHDSLDPLTYTGELAPEIGTFLPPPSVTRVITDGHRLLLSGNGTIPVQLVALAGETAPRFNRLWYTPVLGSSDRGDDERIPITSIQRNYLDLGENSVEGTISEIAGPVDGELYSFTRRRIWRLVPTGDLQTPYLVYPISDRLGAVISGSGTEVTAIAGENHVGKPVVYFLSDAGIYRVGAAIELVSFDIQPEVLASDRLNAFLFSYPEGRQLWYCTGKAAGPCRIRVFHWGQGLPDEDGDIRGGWVTWDIAGRAYGFQSGVRHNRQPGVEECQCQALIPYLAGPANSTEPISYFERPEALDGVTLFESSVTFAPHIVTRGEKQFRVGNPVLMATTRPLTQLRLQAIRDFGTETRTATIALAPLAHEGSPTAVVRTVEGLFSGDATVLTLRITDSIATGSTELWRLDWCAVPVTEQEPR